ncbi:MAG TPA: hypothetical protein VF581_10510 [Flavobacterium sp.]|jgi:archaellin
MKRYGNISGSSGVSEFEIADTYILVRFDNDKKIYKYSYARPGRDHVEKMKAFAESGAGLSTYISQNVKRKYEEIIVAPDR